MLSNLLSSVNDAIWSVDLSSKNFIYVNERLADICEIPFSQIKSDPLLWMDLIHPDDASYVKKQLLNITRKLKIEIEHRIITSKGIKWVINKQMLLCDISTQTEILVGVVTDITNRKRAELQLAESEKTYRYLFQNNPNPLWIFDKENLRFLAVNDAAIHLYGYSKEEFLTMTIADIRPAEEVPRLVNQLKNNQAEFNESKYWKHLKKDGSLIYVNISSHEIIFEGRRCEIVLPYDVTEEIKNREAVTIAKNNLNALINTTQDKIWSVDRNYRIMSANCSFSTYFEEISGSKPGTGESVLIEKLGIEVNNYWRKRYNEALKGESVTFIDELNYTGVPIIVEIHFHPIFNDGKEVIGVGCFSRDITRKIEVEKRIMNQNKRLMEIASLASHEIRGPVSSIMGLLNIFNTENMSDPFNKNLIECMKDAVFALDSVIHTIVDKTDQVDSNFVVSEKVADANR